MGATDKKVFRKKGAEILRVVGLVGPAVGSARAMMQRRSHVRSDARSQITQHTESSALAAASAAFGVSSALLCLLFLIFLRLADVCCLPSGLDPARAGFFRSISVT